MPAPNVAMDRLLLQRCLLWSVLAAAATPCIAQLTSPLAPAAVAADAPARDPRGPSADGNYWVEVEVTIFSSVYGGQQYSELPVPDSNNLRYLPQLRTLVNPADSYAFPFAPVEAVAAAPVLAADAAATIAPPVSTEAVVLPINEGPLFSPALPGAFKLVDLERDAYVALDRRFWRFNQLNSRLQSAGEHSVLWHNVWRQPLRARSQAAALQISGGGVFGEHQALEGSIRLSGQGQGIVADLDANLWLTTFSEQPPAVDDGDDTWQLPERPVPPVAAAAEAERLQSEAIQQVPATTWYPASIWHLNQSRDVGPNALYYLDHPALGLLIEIRPYLVPEILVPATSEQQFE